MQFIFPDSLDLVDPSFNFETEERSIDRVHQRDDLYAHEIFEIPPFDGILVSMGIVNGTVGGSRYTIAQRHRLDRVGVREFFRLDSDRLAHLKTMGDCGAFSYAQEPAPPCTVEEVIDFYERLGFDIGVSPDHIVFGYDPSLDDVIPGLDGVPRHYVERQRITLDLAGDFLEECNARGRPFEPVAVAHGWSPGSYAHAVLQLQRIGYYRIALGGLVPLQTHEIAQIVRAANEVRFDDVEFHLLGVTRLRRFDEFQSNGVTSFDSTSPLRQAFKDDRDNYYAEDRTYPALRVPQVEKNVRLKRKISKGIVDCEAARKSERACLAALHAYGRHKIPLEEALEALYAYSEVCGLDSSYYKDYREILVDRPWESCDCEICCDLGIDVLIFRGAERNRRRGFHNLYVFHKQFMVTAGRT